MIYMILAGVMSAVGMWVSGRLKSKFAKYSQMPVQSGMTGKEVAEKMLEHYGVYDVQVLPSNGFLSDHYNPATKTVNLSPDVYNGRHVSAAAVAAHECGHAIQHDTSYSMLKFRSGMVPIVKVASMSQQFLLMGVFMLAGTMPETLSFVLPLAIAAFGITCLFSFVTLPVEFDASKRALAWLDDSGVAQGEEYDGAKDALKWAAMTYVAGALSSLVMVLFLILKFMGRR